MNNKPSTRAYAVTLLALTLLGCNNPTAQEPASAPERAVDGVAAAPQLSTAGDSVTEGRGLNSLLSATPGTSACDRSADVRIAWDVSKRADVANVEVWVGEGKDAKLFASGGPSGEQQSGPWVKSGTTFVLRNHADKSEVDRLTIGGPRCMNKPATNDPRSVEGT